MTLSPDLRVSRRGRPNQHGTTRAKPRALPHRTVVAWDERPGYVQYVDDDLLVVLDAEQGALAL